MLQQPPLPRRCRETEAARGSPPLFFLSFFLSFLVMATCCGGRDSDEQLSRLRRPRCGDWIAAAVWERALASGRGWVQWEMLCDPVVKIHTYTLRTVLRPHAPDRWLGDSRGRASVQRCMGVLHIYTTGGLRTMYAHMYIPYLHYGAICGVGSHSLAAGFVRDQGSESKHDTTGTWKESRYGGSTYSTLALTMQHV